jgi:hypothetical protein
MLKTGHLPKPNRIKYLPFSYFPVILSVIMAKTDMRCEIWDVGCARVNYEKGYFYVRMHC